MAKDTIITPVGVAHWPKIVTPDTTGDYADGKFKTGLILTKQQYAAFLKQLEPFYKGAKFKGGKPQLPGSAKEGVDGVIINAKSQYKPLVVDSKNHPLPDGVEIGGGSKLRLLVAPNVYDKGVSLWLNQVQVIELVERGAGGTSAFDTVDDGYEVSEAEDGSGFDTSEAEDNTESALDI